MTRNDSSVDAYISHCIVMFQGDYHTLMMVDLRTFKVLQNYMGVEVSDNLIKSSFSPDGKFVISGSENGQLCCWNSKTGVKQGDKIWSIRYGKPLLGVDWSQHEHLVALCSY